MAIQKYSPTTMEIKLVTDIKLATEIGVPTQIDIFEISNHT